ncbi:hypothetical protein [Lactobacillus crispatus]|uniref:hypothetical protein n=6 Tax=Lactobacillus crispatus TaxID=47770 RepID=UPI000398E5B9|nr:hypothetical protein [Lactobacillus crispatus]MBI1702629.1 hypothetical protein [Lactobacillus crispatus]MBI1715612.1 hypothetical protein [Lactobacillus crispatus]MCZ3562005.1 hypothetical protein [Lactobacillus crispatus]MCZ3568433.1 hypothetical protein [Lactobacillus crispatus]MCZ3579029.1 hypothetical protein [Lactobacillus crispatus]
MFLVLSQTDWFWIMVWVFILASAFHLWKLVWLAFGIYLVFPALLTLMDGLWRIALIIGVIFLGIKGLSMGGAWIKRKMKQDKKARKKHNMNERIISVVKAHKLAQKANLDYMTTNYIGIIQYKHSDSIYLYDKLEGRSAISNLIMGKRQVFSTTNFVTKISNANRYEGYEVRCPYVFNRYSKIFISLPNPKMFRRLTQDSREK